MAVPRYWREISSRYNLIGVRCNNCGRNYFPPRSICKECRRASIGKMERIKFQGRGRVITYTVIHENGGGFELQIPYVIAMVELEEGVRITSQIVDCKPEDVKIGSEVKAVFRKLNEDGKNGIIHYGYKFILAK